MSVLKKLPVGIEDFRDIRREGFYYVDKTGLIKELLEDWGKVNLFTRPRRFGKTLNMSMFQCFFELGCDKTLFDGLAIAEETELCERYMGKFPVISISLKGTDSDSFSGARSAVCSVIAREALRLRFLLGSDKLSDTDKERYRNIVRVNSDRAAGEFPMTDDVLHGSLRTLTELLARHYGQKVILLIDEYDVPLAKANERDYYDEMVLLVRNLFEAAMKTNPDLYFAVLSGCLRVAKESIFTGLNNFNVFSITDVNFDEYFGFTDREVREMLAYYGIESAYETVKEWYDGYRFGNVDVYCPWDVICYCSRRKDDPELEPQNYWANTSGNEIIRHFIENLDSGLTRIEMEQLVNGDAVQKPIRQELTYKDLYASIDNIWSTLFMTGYLTRRGKAAGNRYNLVIPNREIRNLFTEQIMTLFQTEVKKDGEMVSRFCDALLAGNAPEAEQIFTAFMEKTISVRDTFVRKPTKENFYHGLLLGILSFKSGWMVTSNRESGDGYSDIQILIDGSETGIVIEVKYAGQTDLEAECRRALDQINDLHYIDALREYEVTRVMKYGIACKRKKCRVMLEVEEL